MPLPRFTSIVKHRRDPFNSHISKVMVLERLGPTGKNIRNLRDFKRKDNK